MATKKKFSLVVPKSYTNSSKSNKVSMPIPNADCFDRLSVRIIVLFFILSCKPELMLTSYGYLLGSNLGILGNHSGYTQRQKVQSGAPICANASHLYWLRMLQMFHKAHLPHLERREGWCRKLLQSLGATAIEFLLSIHRDFLSQDKSHGIETLESLCCR